MFDNSEIREFQKAQKDRILGMYNNTVEDPKAAKLITKAEFDEQFPADKFEAYSVQSLTKFREDISKAEGIDDKDLAFKKATSDLKHFVVSNEGKQTIVFVREKEKGE